MRRQRGVWQHRRDAAVAQRRIGRLEACLAITLLLSGNTVETDRTVCCRRHSRIPERLAITFAAKIRMDDEEAEKRETFAVFHHRDGADGDFAERADEKAGGIGFLESERIVEAGIPPLLPCPFEHKLQLTRPHRTNRKFRTHATFPFKPCRKFAGRNIQKC